MNDKISVIIPVYNTGKEAIKLVLKILKSDYKNLEIILVDDGSTDDSAVLLKELTRQYKLRSNGSTTIKFYSKENGGASSARNLGIEKATGKYIAFTDSDDSIKKDFYKKLLAAIKKYEGLKSSGLKVSMAVSGIHYKRVGKRNEKDLYLDDVKGRTPEEDFEDYILRLMYTDGRLYAVNNKLFRADIINHFNIRFDESMMFAEDTKFVLNYLKVANKVLYSRIEFVLEPLYEYSYGTNTSTVGNTSLSWSNWQKSYQDIVEFAGWKPKKLRQKYMRKIYLRWKISHALAVARSNQTFGHKCQHVSILKLIPAEIIVKFRR